MAETLTLDKAVTALRLMRDEHAPDAALKAAFAAALDKEAPRLLANATEPKTVANVKPVGRLDFENMILPPEWQAEQERVLEQSRDRLAYSVDDMRRAECIVHRLETAERDDLKWALLKIQELAAQVGQLVKNKNDLIGLLMKMQFNHYMEMGGASYRRDYR
jgi:hypothetical protein